MKQLSSVLIICALAACSKKITPCVTHESDITVISDMTDSFALRPAAEPILALYDFPTDKDQAAAFRLVLITDKLLNPVEDIHIEEGTVTEHQNVNDEVDFREQLVYGFYDAVRKSFTDFPSRYAHHSSLGHSECFATIASELNLLASRKASQENEDAFSCYTEQGRNMLRINPDKVAMLLQKRCPLPNDLEGVTVYFVYEPLDREQDARFSEMMGIYKRLLKERRARVVVQANNKNDLP
jgi:hypothetical protein